MKFALLLFLILTVSLIFPRARAGEDVPHFKIEHYENGDLVFKGCINLPALATSVDRVCVVEDNKTHIRFVIDEVINTANGGVGVSVYGQGKWVEK